MSDQPRNIDSDKSIEVMNILSGRTFEGLVEIKVGLEYVQLSIDDARQHARYVFEAAEAAESDAFVFKWLTKDIVGDKQAEGDNLKVVMAEFQKFREARRTGEIDT